MFVHVHVYLRDFLFRRTHGRPSFIYSDYPNNRLSSYQPLLPNLIAKLFYF
jgi:hypothetical protein